jgi:succinate dehydrogenase cytochrome b556 subunit
VVPLSDHVRLVDPAPAHRIALAVGSILLAWWLVAVAAGGQVFAPTHAFLASPIGVLLLFLWSGAFFYHLCSGIRHLAWDAGYGFEIRDAGCSASGERPTVFGSGAALRIAIVGIGLSRPLRRILARARRCLLGRHVGGNAGFSIALGLYLVPAGALIVQPWQTALFTAMAVNFVPLFAHANQMSYDPVCISVSVQVALILLVARFFHRLSSFVESHHNYLVIVSGFAALIITILLGHLVQITSWGLAFTYCHSSKIFGRLLVLPQWVIATYVLALLVSLWLIPTVVGLIDLVRPGSVTDGTYLAPWASTWAKGELAGRVARVLLWRPLGFIALAVVVVLLAGRALRVLEPPRDQRRGRSWRSGWHTWQGST